MHTNLHFLIIGISIEIVIFSIIHINIYKLFVYRIIYIYIYVVYIMPNKLIFYI